MTYTQTLDYLFAQLPMFSRVGAVAYKKDLTNTLALCAQLGHPEKKIKTIHIAGTNGKGSVSHMLSAVFQEHGYKTALYTSPHLKNFTERIKLNGLEVPKDWVVDFVGKHQQLIEEIKPSFFEITVVMAFQYFSEQQVDIAIIETGLGGRLDSTNVIQPLLSIITNIGLDHTEMLGETLELIAAEKAGIIKKETPVIISESQAETESVFFQKAHHEQAPILYADRVYSEVRQGTQIKLVNQSQGEILNLNLDLQGYYQTKNAKAVLLATDVLAKVGFRFQRETTLHALSRVKQLTGMQGRFDIVSREPLTIYDVSHNAEGLSKTLAQLSSYAYERLHIVTGFVKDKDIEKVLALFPKQAYYYFTQAPVPRALDAHLLQTQASKYELKGEVYKLVPDAFEAAKLQATTRDCILVIGSFFILGELL